MKKTLFVIDGHALCYRAYYAFIKNPLLTPDGQNVSAIFGFARMLLRLMESEKPDYLLVAFDPPQKSFRFGLYPEYKANRQKMPDELRSQIEEIKQMLDILGIKKLIEQDYEADDVLGSIAAQYASKECEVVLVTGDKDVYQLLGPHVKVLANKKGISEYEIYDEKNIRKKTGIVPDQVTDFMALAGDTSDNIPGVKGIGEKTALSLIGEFGTLDAIYEKIDEVKGRPRELLVRGKDMAYLSKTLVTIRTDIPVGIDIGALSAGDFRTRAARDYFASLGMNSIVRDFFKAEEDTPRARENKDYAIIRTLDELKNAVAAMTSAGEVSVDTETTSIAPVEAELVGMSFSIKEKAGWYLPLYAKGLFVDNYPSPDESLDIVKPMLEDASVKKIGQNIKYDVIVLGNYGITLRGIYFDTMVASYLLDPAGRRHNLDDLAEKYLNYKTTTYKELTGIGRNAVPIWEVPLENLADYATEDADIAFRLYTVFRKKLAEENLEKLFFDVEMPLVIVLADMEKTGVKIDPAHFKMLGVLNRGMLDEEEKKIYEIAGQKFNINSTRELSHILFEKLGLKSRKKTKTGLSTDISVLEALRGSHEIIAHLIAYRTLAKLKNTYIDTLPEIISPKTGRIHTSYNQTVAATGRLSSSDPNLQNIPVRDEFGKGIRKGFVPEKGHLLMSADYSQIELRLAAHLSGDENMIKAFKEGIDIHSLTASRVFGAALDGITPDMRRQAKIINFATIYGVSPYGLSQQAEIGVREAAEFIRIYFETYPGFKQYIERTIAFARTNGYVQTLLGRKRAIPDIASDVSFRREGAERIAINTPIQGTSADMIKVAMINIYTVLGEARMCTRMIMQVHDELVFEVPGEERNTAEKIVREKMEKALGLSVPVVVDIGFGKNWEEAH